MPRKSPKVTDELIFELAKYMGEGWSLPVAIRKTFKTFNTRFQAELLKIHKIREMQDRLIHYKRHLVKRSPQSLVNNHLIQLENMERSRLGLPLKDYETGYGKQGKRKND